MLAAERGLTPLPLSTHHPLDQPISRKLWKSPKINTNKKWKKRRKKKPDKTWEKYECGSRDFPRGLMEIVFISFEVFGRRLMKSTTTTTTTIVNSPYPRSATHSTTVTTRAISDTTDSIAPPAYRVPPPLFRHLRSPLPTPRPPSGTLGGLKRFL